jgi:hypothetical protein
MVNPQFLNTLKTALLSLLYSLLHPCFLLFVSKRSHISHALGELLCEITIFGQQCIARDVVLCCKQAQISCHVGVVLYKVLEDTVQLGFGPPATTGSTGSTVTTSLIHHVAVEQVLCVVRYFAAFDSGAT